VFPQSQRSIEENPFWSGDMGASISPIMPMMAFASVVGDISLDSSRRNSGVSSYVCRVCIRLGSRYETYLYIPVVGLYEFIAP
jgi:hypothetical protein